MNAFEKIKQDQELVLNTPAELKKYFLRDAPLFSSGVQDLKIIYGDCHDLKKGHAYRCLHASVEIEASALVHAVKLYVVDGYNGFDLDRVVAILFELFSDRNGVIEVKNLNQTMRYFTLRFGREGSPVLYVRSRHRFWLEDLAKIEAAAKADEISIESDGSLRIWWD